MKPLTTFKRQVYVQESRASSMISQFRYNVAPLGNKYPRVGRLLTQRDCPLCPQQTRNTVSHLALFCPFVERVRKELTSLSSFRNSCFFKGFSEDYIFQLFINGYDSNEKPVDAKVFLERGAELSVLLDSWLDKW